MTRESDGGEKRYEELYSFGSKFAETYEAACVCGRTIQVSTQKDNAPEYYTDVFVRCSCGRAVKFKLPVN